MRMSKSIEVLDFKIQNWKMWQQKAKINWTVSVKIGHCEWSQRCAPNSIACLCNRVCSYPKQCRVDFIQGLNFRIGIHSKVQLWLLIENYVDFFHLPAKITKARFVQVGIFYTLDLFALKILLVKKLGIEKILKNKILDIIVVLLIFTMEKNHKYSINVKKYFEIRILQYLLIGKVHS